MGRSLAMLVVFADWAVVVNVQEVGEQGTSDLVSPVHITLQDLVVGRSEASEQHGDAPGQKAPNDA